MENIVTMFSCEKHLLKTFVPECDVVRVQYFKKNQNIS